MKDSNELKIWKLVKMSFNNQYCIINEKYHKINKINKENGIILCRNMHNISEKIKIHESEVTFIDKSEVPILFR